MKTNVLCYLEHSAEVNPDKCAMLDDSVSFSYREVLQRSRKIGTALSSRISRNQDRKSVV